MLRPRNLIETKRHPRLMQSLPDEIAAFGGHMIISLAENHYQLAFDVSSTLQAVVCFASAKAMRVDVGCEVAYCCADAFVEGAAVG